jgi:L-seryl-tRNA(Ser) seleniumtransferase
VSMTEQLRDLPSVDAVLQHPKVAALRTQHSHALLTNWIRAAIADCRQRLLAGETIDSSSMLGRVLDHVATQGARDHGQSVRRVINATGILLHTNLGRSPLAAKASERMSQAAGYASVELNLETGRRSKRGGRVVALLAQLSGAEDALVVNNCAAATILVLQTLAAGREVIVSRGQLVEIGGGFRLPDVFRAAGVRLCEVGTTNRTYLRDYESAIGEQTAAIIRVHRSNFFQAGFVTEPSIDEMVSIPRPNDLPVIDDLGSGCVDNLNAFGINEPTVLDSVKLGADLTLFSGDKLFGGPQAGIIVGRKAWIEPLRTSPMMRAMRVDKLTLAALEATAEIHLAGTAMSDIPILSMIATSADQVCQRCERMVAGVANDARVQIVACESQVGGGSVPGATIPSYAVKVTVDHIDSLAYLLRSGTPAVQGRIGDQSLLLDLRTVADHEVASVAQILSNALHRTDTSA